jgi:hypothetical protein
MSSLILLLATLNLNTGLINIAASSAGDLETCRAQGEALIHKAITEPGSYASYACHDASGQTGVLGVVAYQMQTTGKLKIVEGAKPTLDACKQAGQKALDTKIVSGAMSWSCFKVADFE